MKAWQSNRFRRSLLWLPHAGVTAVGALGLGAPWIIGVVLLIPALKWLGEMARLELVSRQEMARLELVGRQEMARLEWFSSQPADVRSDALQLIALERQALPAVVPAARTGRADGSPPRRSGSDG
jgi:hypothetical protein